MDLVSRLVKKQLTLQECLENRQFNMCDFNIGDGQAELIRLIKNNEIDPQSDWLIGTRELEKESSQNARAAMREHWLAAYRQVAYFEFLYRDSFIKNADLVDERKMLLRNNQLCIDLSEVLAWGFYHWAFAEDFFGISLSMYAKRAKAGGRASADKQRERDVILHWVIKTQLEYNPPNNRGWPSARHTAELLAKTIENLAKTQHYPIGLKGKDLEATVLNLLLEEKNIKRIFKQCSIM